MRIEKFIIWTLILFSCGNSRTPTEERTSELPKSIKEKPTTKPSTTEDFNSFLKRWNVDSSFQLSRIKFPLDQDFLDPHERGEATLTYEDSTDWVMYVDLEYLDEYHDGLELEFEQDTVWNGRNIVTIQQRGDFSMPETQWHVDYTFELINGKWFLTSSVDFVY
ncbi:MAG: hypothetical protein RIA69_01125 [Cyclobacteriaceae bacterium]